ncbi:MAG: hypothetical protein JSV88_24690, partial [Candidatus Aminicenantes bacterium]
MKQVILFIVMIILVSGAYAKMPDYLPQAAELQEWEAVGTPQHVVGDDLFLLINGAAEIYHEYG